MSARREEGQEREDRVGYVRGAPVLFCSVAQLNRPTQLVHTHVNPSLSQARSPPAVLEEDEGRTHAGLVAGSSQGPLEVATSAWPSPRAAPAQRRRVAYRPSWLSCTRIPLTPTRADPSVGSSPTSPGALQLVLTKRSRSRTSHTHALVSVPSSLFSLGRLPLDRSLLISHFSSLISHLSSLISHLSSLISHLSLAFSLSASRLCPSGGSRGAWVLRRVASAWRLPRWDRGRRLPADARLGLDV